MSALSVSYRIVTQQLLQVYAYIVAVARTDPLSETLGGGVEAYDLALQIALFPLERRVLAAQVVEVLAQAVAERLQVAQVPLVVLDIALHRLRSAHAT